MLFSIVILRQGKYNHDRKTWGVDMKKIILLMLLLAFMIVTPTSAASEGVSIVINDQSIQFDCEPVIIDGSLYAPVRQMSYAYGASVNYYPKTKTVMISYRGSSWGFVPGSTGVYANGRFSDSNVQAINQDGTVMVPVRFLSEVLGFRVTWQKETRTAILSNNSDAPQEALVSGDIMGEAQATAQQMADYLLKYNPNPLISCTAFELATIYLEEGAIEGVRGDIAFAQSIHETGFFRVGGSVLPEQYNFAGLGATGGGTSGLYFASVREGVRAQIQHLKAYASALGLEQACVDPRFTYVSRATAIHVEQLAQALNTSGTGWAYPRYDTSRYSSAAEAYAAEQTYGQLILKHLKNILK